ncbi:hypothetical protein LU676_30035 [Pseudomonas alloputida]|uniref:hypothetical protein n=1 Tax=Pseudomonas putida group TaxID=136845 RepID=UPI000BEF4F94|nr:MULTISPECIES: hypothetical protein [Pseudomonas putida group]MCE0906979.1 hypothetical protein [Pseudomonas alloputida]MDD2023249.1 hypothetical protein [Pseudomonas putida]PEI10164.1 hypothetical protein CRM86_20620 [Pseudomonas putida]
MAKKVIAPYGFVAVPLIALGATFAAVGAAGQSAFAYTAAGLLVPGIALLVLAVRDRIKS